MSNRDSARKKILIIEDDRDIRETLRELLEMEGYGVSLMADGQEALIHLQANGPPDLILLDLMMPGMSGWELIEKLQNDPRLALIPVLVLSASQPRQWPGGASGYLRKPMQINELLEKIHELCG